MILRSGVSSALKEVGKKPLGGLDNSSTKTFVLASTYVGDHWNIECGSYHSFRSARVLWTNNSIYTNVAVMTYNVTYGHLAIPRIIAHTEI